MNNLTNHWRGQGVTIIDTYSPTESAVEVFPWEICHENRTFRIIINQGTLPQDCPRGGHGISYRF